MGDNEKTVRPTQQTESRGRRNTAMHRTGDQHIEQGVSASARKKSTEGTGRQAAVGGQRTARPHGASRARSVSVRESEKTGTAAKHQTTQVHQVKTGGAVQNVTASSRAKTSERSSGRQSAVRENSSAQKSSYTGRGPYPSPKDSGDGKKGLMIGVGILLLVLIVAASLFVMRFFGTGSKEEETTSETMVFDENVIQKDLYLDYSAFSSEKNPQLLNMKGMNREQVAEAVKSAYEWTLTIVNANPNLDSFEMPDLPKTTEAEQEGEAETDEAVDNEGTAQMVEIEDPLAHITIRPSKSEFQVPDLIEGSIESYVDQIFEDYSAKAETSALVKEESGEEDSSSSVQQADYVLALPDVEDELKDYLTQLSLLWNVEAKSGDITSYDEDSDKFIFGGDIKGYELDVQKLGEDVMAAIEAGDYTASIETTGTVTEPSSDDAANQYKTISSFTTKTTSNATRNKNVQLSCEAINGYILKPGQEFSFNDVVGERTVEKGYGAAAAYNNGEVVQEVGGGVCQTSTTLYNAVFRAGLTSTYRRSHTFEPSYVTPGMDATVSWGGPDYRFVNNSDHAIGIRASYSNQTCTVSIYGIPLLEEGITWDLSSVKVRDNIPPSTKIIESGTPSAGSFGSEWAVYKVVKKNGEEIERTKDHSSVYKGHTQTILSPDATTAAPSAEETSSVAESSTSEVPVLPGETTQPAILGPGESATTAATQPVPTPAATQPVPTPAATQPVPTPGNGPGEVIQNGP